MEQAIGGLVAFYYNSKVDANKRADGLEFMPHEDKIEKPQMDLFDFISAQATEIKEL